MANTAIGGFRFKRQRNGSGRALVEPHTVASGYATAIFRGDPVKRVATGTIEVALAGDANILGIADGAIQFSGRAIQANSNFLPASTVYSGAPILSNPNASVVNVILGRDAVFEIDVNTAQASDTAAQSLVGNNADHVAAAGNTSSGRSAYVLNGVAPSTLPAQWRIVELPSSNVDATNDVTAVNWKALVELNESNEPQYSTTGD